jgi:hypothetical protein
MHSRASLSTVASNSVAVLRGVTRFGYVQRYMKTDPKTTEGRHNAAWSAWVRLMRFVSLPASPRRPSDILRPSTAVMANSGPSMTRPGEGAILPRSRWLLRPRVSLYRSGCAERLMRWHEAKNRDHPLTVVTRCSQGCVCGSIATPMRLKDPSTTMKAIQRRSPGVRDLGRYSIMVDAMR